MKNFYDSTVINNGLVLELVVLTEQQKMKLYLDDRLIYDDISDHIFYHIKTPDQPFELRLEVANANLVTSITIDKIAVYPKYYQKTYDMDKTDTMIRVSITKPFYSWLHQQMNGGWILYDHSTYQ